MEKSNEQELIDDKYVIQEKIGFGGQANAFLVKDKKNDELYVAKVEKEYDKFIDTEIEILNKLKQYNNQSIINIIYSGEGDIIRNNRETKKRKYCILEYAPNGNIFDYIYCKRRGLGEQYTKIIFKKIIEAVKFCHEHNICHRDIKLENILLDKDFNPKICDFGFACENVSDLNKNLGTSGYKPPEVSKSKQYDGFKVDIFCLGVTLMILVTGNPGFNKATRIDKKYHMIMQKKYDEYWHMVETQTDIIFSQEFKDLYIKMINYNPQQRPTAEEVLKHEWFKEINDMNEEQINDLENKVKEEFIKLKDAVKDYSQKEIQAAERISKGSFYNTRGFSDNYDKFFYNNMKPKKLMTPMNMNMCIKIKGYVEPIKFMNLLTHKISDKFGDNCFIETGKERLKLNIIFEEEENEEVNNDGEGNNEEDEDEEESNEYGLMLQLYKSNDEYLLRFIQSEGERKQFLDKFEAISKLVEDILC